MRIYRWIEWNIDKVQKHGLEPPDVEHLIDHASRPYPRRADQDKWLVRGQASAGRYIQAIYLIEEDNVTFVIHARPLTETEIRNLRRSRR